MPYSVLDNGGSESNSTSIVQTNGGLCNAGCNGFTFCADGVLQAPNGSGRGGPSDNGYEDCDDANSSNADDCLNSCRFSYCGDGVVQTPNHAGFNEQCDDGNPIDGDGCQTTCIITP